MFIHPQVHRVGIYLSFLTSSQNYSSELENLVNAACLDMDTAMSMHLDCSFQAVCKEWILRADDTPIPSLSRPSTAATFLTRNSYPECSDRGGEWSLSESESDGVSGPYQLTP
jgi:hypothetical protein